MAEIIFELTDIDGKHFVFEKLLSYTLSSETDAACDGLQLHFLTEGSLPELKTVTAFADGEKIFFGYVDYQQACAGSNGFSATVYARSSACILLDNEAEPFTYIRPSAYALFMLHAKPFGFESALPTIYCEADYTVSKGTSCYGAVNRFVSGISGKNLRVSPDNVLYLPEGKNLLIINPDEALEEARSVNRGDTVSSIDYKANGDTQYRHHIKSRYLEGRGFQKSQKLNLASLPGWQQAFTLRRRLESAAREYQKAELLLKGVVLAELYAPVSYSGSCFGSLNGYYVDSYRITLDSSGARTRITLLKKLELEEISYVA